MKVITFDYVARFGHFLRAEANANALSYPVPPRTVVLGLLGAVLGLSKDEPQESLADAQIGVRGSVPQSHWHKANLRKDPPSPLPWVVKKTDKGSNAEQRNTILPQQWLFQPVYRVWVSLPEPYHGELASRLEDRRWHFTPCMGLSEMMADLTFIDETEATPAGEGVQPVLGVVRFDAGAVDTTAACQQGLAIQTLRMPRSVTPDRVFSHATYQLERDGRPIPVETGEGWKVGEEVVVFM